MPRRALLLLVWLWERMVAPDPGLLRLHFALSVLASVSLTLFSLIAIDQFITVPFGAYALGFLVAQFTAVSVRDSNPRAQKRTIVLIPLPALAGFGLAIPLQIHPIVLDAGFLLVVFLAVYAPRLGPRYSAFGMVLFIAYYMGAFLHPQLSMLPLALLAVGIGTGANMLVRFVLLRPDPAAALPRVIASIRLRIARILGEVSRVLGAETPDLAAQAALRRHLSRLKEAVLLAEDQIAALNPAGQAAAGAPLALHVFALELSAERLVQLAQVLPPSPNRPALARIAKLQRDLLTEQRDRGGPLVWLYIRVLIRKLPPRRPSANPVDPRIAPALDRLARALASMPGSADLPREIQVEAPVAPVQPETGAKPNGWREPNLRAAIQVTVATAVAIALGEIVSPQRWYWGVIAAFVMFSGAGPRAVTITKALQRMLGTAGGVVVGLMVAHLVAGHVVIGIALVLLCDFLAFQAFQAAYSVMMFWITILLSLLYGFLGLFTPQLLVLRLEETGIGIAAGIVIALLLLPTGTRAALRDATRDFLATFATAMEAIVAQLRDGGRGAEPVAQARALDRSLQAMRAVAGPLARGWTFATPRAILQVVRAATACTYAVHELAELSQTAARPSAVEASWLASLAAVTREEIASVRAALEARRTPMPVPVRTGEMAESEVVTAMERVRAAEHMLAQALAGTFRDR